MNSFYSQQARCTVRWQELPGQGEPLVFIHGLGCASSYEYPRIVCDPMFGSRRAILIDLPGSGYSDKPETFSYQTSAQAQVVIELLNHLAITSFWLYGHSMGGSIAIEAAELAGSRLLGLMVSEPNFHAGGGAFSRGIAARTEDDFVRSGYQAMLEAETSPLERMPAKQCPPGRYGVVQRVWLKAYSPAGARVICNYLARYG
ncbi:alpha/beta hydrolase [Leclercia sp. S52]|uniref:alpha/beta fold hydrolase n=1 Tax=Leclercia sp. S52 TaxID=3138178 RepID=UPI00321B0B68